MYGGLRWKLIDYCSGGVGAISDISDISDSDSDSAISDRSPAAATARAQRKPDCYSSVACVAVAVMLSVCMQS